MALSGEIGNTFREGYRIQIEWEAVQDVANNRSTVTARFYLISLGSFYTINSSASKALRIAIDGTTYNHSVNVGLLANQKKLLATSSRSVNHSSDGTKVFSLSGALDLQVTLSGVYWGTVSIPSQYFTLDAIPRTSTPTLSHAIRNVGDSISVYTNRASTVFTHRIRMRFGGITDTIATGVSVSNTFVIPKVWANRLSSNTVGTVTVYLDTYSGNTFIGTETITFTLTIPDTAEFRPTVSTATDTEAVSGLAAKFSAYVQGKSRLRAQMNSSGAYGSTITQRSIRVGNTTYNGEDITTDFLQSSGTLEITYMVTDSRGRVASLTRTVSVISYSNPSAASIDVSRVNPNGSSNDEGIHALVTLQGSISPVGNSNDIDFKLRYKKTTEESWNELTLSNATYVLSTSEILSGMDSNSAYDFEFLASDYFTTSTKARILPTAFTLVDYLAGGKGIAFGEVATEEGMNVGLDMKLKGKVDIIARTNTEEDGGLLRFKRLDGSMLAFLATGPGGKGLNLRMSDGSNSWTGFLSIAEDGSINSPSTIVESGSNVNGRYVKFGDGTMICFMNIISVEGAGTYTLPATFHDSTYSLTVQISGIASAGTAAAYISECVAQSASTIRAKALLLLAAGGINYAVGVRIMIVAIGRWR